MKFLKVCFWDDISCDQVSWGLAALRGSVRGSVWGWGRRRLSRETKWTLACGSVRGVGYPVASGTRLSLWRVYSSQGVAPKLVVVTGAPLVLRCSYMEIGHIHRAWTPRINTQDVSMSIDVRCELEEIASEEPAGGALGWA